MKARIHFPSLKAGGLQHFVLVKAAGNERQHLRGATEKTKKTFIELPFKKGQTFA